MLKTIFTVSGKSGLYKMISQGKNLLIIESLTDKKRIPAYVRDKVVSLGDIAIYTHDEEVPLYKVLNGFKEKEACKQIQLDIAKASPNELRDYFAEILPEFDRERVYPSEIKRMIIWYNILLNAGITEFDPEEETETESEKNESDDEQEAGKKQKEDVTKEVKSLKTVTLKKTTAPKNTTVPTKQQPATGKMRQRTKSK